MRPGDVSRRWLLALLVLLISCARPQATPAPGVGNPNLDAETQSLIARAQRVVFIIPFSHWDTDWHDTFPAYVQRSDQNILAALKMAKQDSRFRYTLEQTLFVQHFWDNYPQYRADLRALVQTRQFTFAWAGITQPETSLAAPTIQLRNLQMGEDWIAQNFGAQYVPHTAWQSDAFGNSAALPVFLNQFGIPYLFIGRWQHRCDPDYANCTPLPLAFYWDTPIPGSSSSQPAASSAGPARVLVAYLSYPTAWDAIHTLGDMKAQLAALHKIVDAQFARTSSKYVFLPMGSDFQDPLPNLPALVAAWNAADNKTVLVMADPETAFQYLATQNLPTYTVDMNPIWQSFYGTRPQAKIADKESEYYLTAADKFGLLLDTPSSSAWYTATINAHYDNLGAVSFDSVWGSTQQPRFEQTVAMAANDLAATLARIAGDVAAPVVIFNPTSWSRSEIVEMQGDVPDTSALPAPVQRIGANGLAFRAAAVPAIGFAAPTAAAAPPSNPARVSSGAGGVTLGNGLVSVTLDPAHGGVFSRLASNDGRELISTFGDDVTYIDDRGDVYGSFFGSERARESRVPAQVKVLAEGPLVARAQAAFDLGNQPVTKTVTVRADDPLIQVELQIAALPETSAIAQTATTLQADQRTDDLGLTPFEHPMDNHPIVPGDVTYRREIFYPITYWGEVSSGGASLALITHGLQGLGGTGTLNLLLVRDVTQRDEGVTDTGYHTLRYAYLPGAGSAAQVVEQAYAFNQPLIPAWRAGDMVNVALPFETQSRQFRADPSPRSFTSPFSLLSAQNGIVADLYRRGDQVEAFVLDYDPAIPPSLRIGAQEITLPAQPLTLLPVVFK